jgi:hypothetical protein
VDRVFMGEHELAGSMVRHLLEFAATEKKDE